MGAVKNDKGKAPLSLIPRSALIAEARVMAAGREKYTAHNWRGGMEWSRLLDAALRHITAFNEGQDYDDGEGGTGELHLANARCCLAFLIEYHEQGLGTDDRFKAPVAPPTERQIAHYSLQEKSPLAKEFSESDTYPCFLIKEEAEQKAQEFTDNYPGWQFEVKAVFYDD